MQNTFISINADYTTALAQLDEMLAEKTINAQEYLDLHAVILADFKLQINIK